MHVKIIGIAAGIGIILYLTYKAASKPISAIAINANTQLPAPPMSTLFSSPSPVIAQSNLPTAGITTGPSLYQNGQLPLTPSSPSLLVPLNGDPGVGSGGVADTNIYVDYPGIQTYMIDPNAPDPNSVLT